MQRPEGRAEHEQALSPGNAPSMIKNIWKFSEAEMELTGRSRQGLQSRRTL